MAKKKTTKKTGTYKASTSSKASYGTSSAANKALQTSLNKKGAGLTVDGKYGPLTAAAVAKYGGSSSNPMVTSKSPRADIGALDIDIRGLKRAYSDEQALYQQYQQQLAERREKTIGSIKDEFDIAQKGQEAGQESRFASRSTGLITSGGGFLGTTQSQEGVLENLRGDFESEKTALMAKREAAILAAEQAYEDKDFALAKEMSANARELQKEIYNRQKDFADNALSLSREKRAQTEFDLGIADKKVNAFAMMDDFEFDQQDPQAIAEIDASYFPGYTRAARAIAKQALDIKTQKDAISLDQDILDMRLKMPKGQRFELGGKTYTGLKDASANQSELNDQRDNDIAEIIMDFQKQIQTRGWSGIDQTAYNYYREKLAQSYGAAAALKLDKAILDAELEVDYDG